MSEVRVIKVDDPCDNLRIALESVNRYANIVIAENEGLKDMLSVTPSNYTGQEAVANITRWHEDGELVLRTDVGIRSVVAKKIKRGELFPTSFGAILATSEAVRNTFESYIDKGVVMDANKLAVKYNLNTRFSIERACQKVKIKKISCFGTNITLYAV